MLAGKGSEEIPRQWSASPSMTFLRTILYGFVTVSDYSDPQREDVCSSFWSDVFFLVRFCGKQCCYIFQKMLAVNRLVRLRRVFTVNVVFSFIWFVTAFLFSTWDLLLLLFLVVGTKRIVFFAQKHFLVFARINFSFFARNHFSFFARNHFLFFAKNSFSHFARIDFSFCAKNSFSFFARNAFVFFATNGFSLNARNDFAFCARNGFSLKTNNHFVFLAGNFFC